MSHEITKYVSNTDRDIYTVSNLPEEVIAVIFAYVSRSPKGFRENIGRVIEEEELGQERAAKFHEKWVLHYGHASVAEHATVHVGIERASRLFSSILELSNEYLSFTEYSQRYQRPQRGEYFIPPELDERPQLKSAYRELNDALYDTYAELNQRLFDYLKKTLPLPEEAKESAHLKSLEKMAFEDARYALSLATFTNLGMTSNARAMEDSLSKLLSSKYPEVRARAEEIKREVRFSVPTLVKYANPNPYYTETREELESLEYAVPHYPHPPPPPLVTEGGGWVKLLDFTGKGSSDPQARAVEKLVRSVIFAHSRWSYEEAVDIATRKGPEFLLEVFKKSVQRMGKFDNPLNALRLVNYEAEFSVSEACWHQLLRHRKVNWLPQEPTVHAGYEIPPQISEAGLEEILLGGLKRSEELYERLMDEGLEEAASYVVTNAHLRRVVGDFDLWEFYHLINLRMSEGAQWDIRSVIGKLAEEVSRYHPQLVKPALERVENK